MNRKWSSAIKARHYRSGERIVVYVEDSYISKIDPVGEIEAEGDTERLSGDSENTERDLWIGPGLVDLQVNGYLGFDFNTLPIAVDRVSEVTQTLFKEGVTTYFPTITTNSAEAIEESLRSITHALKRDPFLAETIKGIHLEGPFISPEDGPRGAHPQEHVQAPDWNLFSRWQEAAEGRIKLLTLSPEWPGSVEFIKTCVAGGVKVAIGHTAATTEQISEAVAAGATFSTHLGNGSHPMLPRHPNYIWDQLAEERLWAGMIADGFHLPAAVLKVIFKVKAEKTVMVSDSVYLAGLAPGQYQTHIGGSVVLTSEGKLHLAENPKLLAGSVKTLKQGIEHLAAEKLCDLGTAWDLASLHPSRFMDFSTQDGLKPGAPADLVVFKRHGERIQVLDVMKNGLAQIKL